MLEIINLSKMMEIFPVINNVSFMVNDGEMIAICGDPFGGDLVLQAIPGLIRIKRGSVSLDGEVIAGYGMTKKSEDFVEKFSYISKNGTLLWEKSFDYNLKLREKWFENYHAQKAIDTLEALAPDFNRKKKANHMTDQELVLAAFALGMGMESKYFLVDALWWDIPDGETKEKCLKMLKEKQDQGCSVLVVMDDFFLLGPGRDYFKRIIYMKQGALIVDSTPQVDANKPLEFLLEEWKRVAK